MRRERTIPRLPGTRTRGNFFPRRCARVALSPLPPGEWTGMNSDFRAQVASTSRGAR